MKSMNLKIAFRKAASTVTALALLFTVVKNDASFRAKAVEVSNGVWDGNTNVTNVSYAGGTGTAEDPFLIDDAAQLYKMVSENGTNDNSGTKYFKIQNDIYLNDVANNSILSIESPNQWYTTSGDYDFSDVVDGDYHTIYGIYAVGKGYTGFLPKLSNGTVKNLKFSQSYIEGKYAGVIAGAARIGASTSISNCLIDNTVTVNGTVGAGGFTGYVGSTFLYIQDSCSMAAINAKTDTAAVAGFVPVTNTSTSCKIRVRDSWAVAKNAVIAQNTATVNIDNSYVISADKLNGAEVRSNMPGLAWNTVWFASKDFPLHKSFMGDYTNKEWDGSKADSYAGGSGTEEDPYKISNAAQLYKMVSESSADDGVLYYELTNDIYVNDINPQYIDTPNNWYPGTSSYYFNDNFNGNGYTVFGLYATTKSSNDRVALFPQISDGAVISNLKITEAYVKGVSRVGCLVGAAYSTVNTSATVEIECCSIENSDVIATTVNGSIGGIIGFFSQNASEITNCCFNGNLKGVTSSTSNKITPQGGIVGDGWTSYVAINNCWSFGVYPVSGTHTGNFKLSTIYTNIEIPNETTSGTTPSAVAGITSLTDSQMLGKAAVVGMPSLDWNAVWKNGVEGMTPSLYSSQDVSPYWNGETASDYAGGQGTQESPYVIANASQLYKMVSENGTDDSSEPKYFVLSNDIYINNSYVSDENGLNGPQWPEKINSWYSGTNAYYFNDHFDGKGFTIYGIYSDSKDRAGLFPQISDGASVTALNIKNSEFVSSAGKSGAIAGMVFNSDNSVERENVSIMQCSVEGSKITGKGSAGGLVGMTWYNGCDISDSYFRGELTCTGSTNCVGGILPTAIALKINNSITNCYSVGYYPVYADSSIKNINISGLYTNVTEDTNGKTTDKVSSINNADMLGQNAIENMPSFNWNTLWKTGAASEYPTFYAKDEISVYWDGTAAMEYEGGTGTESDPYLISNAQQLYLLASSGEAETSGKYYKLTKNIEISRVYSGWTDENARQWISKPVIISSEYMFGGTLDGAGYTVNGLFVKQDAKSSRAYGLIPMVGSNAVIKNLKLTNTYIDVNYSEDTNSSYVGAISGYAGYSSTDKDEAVEWPLIVSCSVKGTLSGQNVGGIAGCTNGSKIELSSFDGNFDIVGNTTPVNAGGIAGNSMSGEIANCYTTAATVSGTQDAVVYASAAGTTDGLNEDLWSITGTAPLIRKLDVQVISGLNGAADIALIRKYLIGATTSYITDSNGDALVDVRDLVHMKKYAAKVENNDGYVLTFREEFDSDSLNSSLWDKQNRMGATGDVTTDWGNATVSDGQLTLAATEGETTAYAVANTVTTQGKMSFKYGKLEMRAKIPTGAGACPSLWLASKDAIGANADLAYRVEVDVFELYGKTGIAESFFGNAHKWYNVTDEADENIKDANYKLINGADATTYTIQDLAAFNEAYHDFVLEWTPEEITASIDGNIYMTIDMNEDFDLKAYMDDYGKTGMGGFAQPLSIMLNNHMFTPGSTGYFNYTGEEEITVPMNYDIDYIRLYQNSAYSSELNFAE